MTAKRLKRSWEKQTYWELSNGMIVTEEWNQVYGPFIMRIEDKEGSWNASSGRHTMPDRFKFILQWDDGKLIRPNFKKTF